MKLIATLGALLLASTAASAAPFGATDHFVSKSGYIVEVTQAGSTMKLRGRNPKTGTTFDISVSPNGHATGIWGGEPLDRVIPLDGSASKTTQVASIAP